MNEVVFAAHPPGGSQMAASGVPKGVTWRWWVFDPRGGTHLDTGVIDGEERATAERAANDAVERLKLQK